MFTIHTKLLITFSSCYRYFLYLNYILDPDLYCYIYYVTVGRDRVIGTATHYELDGQRIESR